MTADIVLWLDLAEANQMEDAAVREHIPRGPPVLRLTERGAVPCPAGAPTRWRPVLDAIDRLVRDARKLEKQSPGSGLSAGGEPPKLLERDPGCASALVLVRRR